MIRKLTRKLTKQYNREPEYPIEPIIINRCSLRALSGEAMSDEELLPLFEAAKWAPSAFNSQPWRFTYAKRGTATWPLLLDCLNEFNQMWAKNASVLVVVASRSVFEANGKPSPTHAFDTGAAWENLAIQGCSRGFVVHAISSINYEKAKAMCKLPNDFQVQAMIAIGKPGRKEDLPNELQQIEGPSTRKPLQEIIVDLNSPCTLR
eukprot:Filipodium_phascolosomae@DN6944_c0_g1_i1.p1